MIEHFLFEVLLLYTKQENTHRTMEPTRKTAQRRYVQIIIHTVLGNIDADG